MLLVGKNTFKVLQARFGLENKIGIFPSAGDFQGKVLRESRAGHSMVPLLPHSSWEFHDSLVPSATAGPLIMTNRSENEFWPRDKEFNEDFWFWHFQVACGRPFSTMPPLLE